MGAFKYSESIEEEVLNILNHFTMSQPVACLTQLDSARQWCWLNRRSVSYLPI
jgi:hypothetical protein